MRAPTPSPNAADSAPRRTARRDGPRFVGRTGTARCVAAALSTCVALATVATVRAQAVTPIPRLAQPSTTASPTGTSAPSTATPLDLARLTQLLARIPAGSAAFVERRTVSVLDRTLESSGRLLFEPPDTFVRETLKPRREKVEVHGNVATMSLGSRSRTVQLDTIPEAALMVAALRGTLTGDRAVLEQNFVATVDGTAQRWTLELTPRQPLMRERVISVRIGGSGSVVRQVDIAMADGDRSEMTIDPVLPAGAAGGAASDPGGASPRTGT